MGERLNRARGADMKESFNVKSPAIYSNDFSGCPDDFKSAALSVWDKAMVAADRYALAAALALGLEAGFCTTPRVITAQVQHKGTDPCASVSTQTSGSLL